MSLQAIDSPLERCRLCGRRSRRIARSLQVCGSCIRRRPHEASHWTTAAHHESRRRFGLPVAPPRTPAGVSCGLCARQCVIGEGGRGYCGLRTVRHGRLVHLAGSPRRGLLHWYRDPLPTNCVADWVCAGHHRHGSHNLAVFYASCTVDCLFCQNWSFREVTSEGASTINAAELAAAANAGTFCVCFFGGDPASQVPHALAAAQRLAARGVRVCWETAGTSHPKLMDRATRLSLESGGCVKFDVKAFDDSLHSALTGASNEATLANFARAAQRFAKRPDPPLVVASTLLVPGYVDAAEVGRIARFIAALDRRIPYSLLGFAPAFHMQDLPTTSIDEARAAEAAARRAGLLHVHIGNRRLLSH